MTEPIVDGQQIRSIVIASVTSTDGEDLTRTDEKILNLVCDALDGSGYDQLRKLQVYCHNRRITLQGQVATYYMKQVAQSAVRTVSGVCDIDNDLSVFSKK